LACFSGPGNCDGAPPALATLSGSCLRRLSERSVLRHLWVWLDGFAAPICTIAFHGHVHPAHISCARATVRSANDIPPPNESTRLAPSETEGFSMVGLLALMHAYHDAPPHYDGDRAGTCVTALSVWKFTSMPSQGTIKTRMAYYQR
jgi:hypothetical protein